MTIHDLWETYKDYTRDLTEQGRKLAFAGVAICWLFRSVDLTFSFMIYVALLFFIGFFAADVLQYFFGALLHRNLAQKHERNQLESKGKIDRNAEIIKPRWLDWPALCFFLAKGIFLTLGFLSIGVQLLLKLVN